MPRKVKNIKVGEWVIVSQFCDRDYQDAWAIGIVEETGRDTTGRFYRLRGNPRGYRHVWRLSGKSEAVSLLAEYNRENKKLEE